ncbi:UDP-N-acetylmuramoyl-tripeptide--D-alanyl-D-alanine ligase [Evansella vedderi]|uniref:UDP-N-acetylmuramoyl-tripeptide--D-alanyl-D-alanine ligase n=1 Tax=Evansella vedderi TaxID=38282 RepID=A0ABT9ZS67_9BACI|nr:Mur ligase family protein [Evansella vedderi]MDQ0253820.1 UDP-N-acetylmuramoyl-tripeptide--D-alanyl-D-alanine ligase [Evansella vedderi]
MANLNISFVKSFCTDITGNISSSFIFNGVSTESKEVMEGNLFIPLKDEGGNEKKEVLEAIKNGAAALIWSKERAIPEDLPDSFPVFWVEDIKQTIQKMAKRYMEEVDPTVIAVTGGEDKAITKELIAATLKKNYHVHTTSQSKSPWMDLCLGVLNMDAHTNVFIGEYGSHTQGDISKLSHLIEPNIAVITSIQQDEQEGNKSPEVILEEFSSIESGMRPSAVLVLDGDNTQLFNKEWKTDTVFCGFSHHSLFQIQSLQEENEYIHFELKGVHMPFTLHKQWKQFIKNAVFGIAIAVHLGVLPDEMLASLKEYKK